MGDTLAGGGVVEYGRKKPLEAGLAAAAAGAGTEGEEVEEVEGTGADDDVLADGAVVVVDEVDADAVGAADKEDEEAELGESTPEINRKFHVEQ